MTEQFYIAVKGSLHATDSSVFGLTPEEVNALSKRYPDSNKEVINGVLIKASPLRVINSLCELGYRVICSSGDAEIVWTLRREVLDEDDSRTKYKDNEVHDKIVVVLEEGRFLITNQPARLREILVEAKLLTGYDTVTHVDEQENLPPVGKQENVTPVKKQEIDVKSNPKINSSILLDTPLRSSKESIRKTRGETDTIKPLERNVANKDENPIDNKVERIGTKPEDFATYSTYKGPKIVIKNPSQVDMSQLEGPVIVNTNLESPENPLVARPGASYIRRETPIYCPTEERMEHHHHAPSYSSVHQTFEEMDFERGIWTPAMECDADRVQAFLLKGVHPDMEDRSGYTALHYAARCGHPGICSLLLRNGASVDKPTRAGGATALHRAAFAGRLESCYILLQFGANLHARDVDGRTPLHRAVEGGHREIINEFLRISPAAAFDKDNQGKSPLTYAEEKGALSNLFIDIVK